MQKGFFAAQGIEINKVYGTSGNDIVLKMANGQGDVGYIGYTPAILARTQGIPMTVIAASETEGTSEADNWQNVVVDGSSSIRTPAGPRREDDRPERAQGRRRDRRPGSARQARGRLELREVHRDAVPGDAGCARKRSGRRGPHARALHVADPRRRRPHRPGTRPGSSGSTSRTAATARGRTGCAENPGLVQEVPHGDQPVARVREQPSGRDPCPAAGRDPEHPAADVEPARRPGAAPDARAAGQEVRRHHHAAEHDEVRAELRRRRQDAAGHRRPGLVPHPEARREGRDAAPGGQVHRRGRRQVRDGQLPSERRGREQVDGRRDSGRTPRGS